MALAISIILMGLGAIFTSIFIYGKLTNYSWRTTMFKTIDSLLFLSLGIYLFFYKGQPNVGIFILLGLTFGLLGDVALAFKRIAKNKDKFFTLLGMVMFIIGHAFYTTGLFVNYYIPGNVLHIIIPLVAALIIAISIVIIELKLKFKLGGFKYFGVLYFTALFTVSMSCLSLNILNGFNSTFLILMLVGAVIFASSDILLTRTYFKENCPKGFLISTSITYYVAQFLIAFTIFFL